MMAQAKPKLTLRPFLAADAPLLAEIFRASVSELTGDDYTEAQQDAWIASFPDEDELARRLSSQLTLIATLGESSVGFASLKGTDHIDMLYVHPAAAGQGVGSMLIDALEKLAAARGGSRLTADVSDSAQDFFRHRGFAATQRNTIELGGEWLANTTMEKRLAAKERPQ